MRRIIRDRRLTAEEAAAYQKAREQVAQDLPELIARHHQRGGAMTQQECYARAMVKAKADGRDLPSEQDFRGFDKKLRGIAIGEYGTVALSDDDAGSIWVVWTRENTPPVTVNCGNVCLALARAADAGMPAEALDAIGNQQQVLDLE